MTYHVRKRLRARGGNHFYRDSTVRPSSTFCGDPMTEFDAAWNAKLVIWKNRDGVQMVPCERCAVAVRNEEGGAR